MARGWLVTRRASQWTRTPCDPVRRRERSRGVQVNTIQFSPNGVRLNTTFEVGSGGVQVNTCAARYAWHSVRVNTKESLIQKGVRLNTDESAPGPAARGVYPPQNFFYPAIP